MSNSDFLRKSQVILDIFIKVERHYWNWICISTWHAIISPAVAHLRSFPNKYSYSLTQCLHKVKDGRIDCKDGHIDCYHFNILLLSFQFIVVISHCHFSLSGWRQRRTWWRVWSRGGEWRRERKGSEWVILSLLSETWHLLLELGFSPWNLRGCTMWGLQTFTL